MAEYQNLFTRIQIHGPAYPGVALPRGSWPRVGRGVMSRLLGYFGDAQIGPIYLGTLGVMSLLCGFIAIEMGVITPNYMGNLTFQLYGIIGTAVGVVYSMISRM